MSTPVREPESALNYGAALGSVARGQPCQYGDR